MKASLKGNKQLRAGNKFTDLLTQGMAARNDENDNNDEAWNNNTRRPDHSESKWCPDKKVTLSDTKTKDSMVDKRKQIYNRRSATDGMAKALLEEISHKHYWKGL